MEKEVLVDLLKRGDNEAFKTLVELYQQQIINICYGYLHDQVEAEDIAQDVFVEVFRSVRNFRGEADIKTWIYRIAVNKSLNRKKKLKKYLRKNMFDTTTETTDTGNVSEPRDDTPDAQETIEIEERKKIIHDAINKLSGNQKTAFVLRKYDDLSYKDIAEIMKISIPSVESLLFRAKSSVQKTLLKQLHQGNL